MAGSARSKDVTTCEKNVVIKGQGRYFLFMKIKNMLCAKTTARSLLWGLCVWLWTTFYAGPTILRHIIGPCNRWVSLHPDSLNNGSHDTVSQPAEYHTKGLGF